MENTVENLLKILNHSQNEIVKLDQVSKFEETIKNLQKVIDLKTPSYSFPQVDTIGLRTYISLNKK